MKTAVIGGGTAGFMAAAHLSRRFPEVELVHVYDSQLPALGVGEGTLPAFPRWLRTITGLEMPALGGRCDATYKLGVRFEGWGREHSVFFHNFAADTYAYHLSAQKLPALLGSAIDARRVEARVEEVVSDGRQVTIRLAEGEELVVDFAVDARGFPPQLEPDLHLELAGIPTNAALLQRGPAARLKGGTRAVARAHGWIFVIPLARDTSYGYLYDQRLASDDEVSADLERFFGEEKVRPRGDSRRLAFPSFRRRSFFDGALFHLGNAASFLEPLEATAIGLILFQLQVATLWLGDELVGVGAEEKWSPAVLSEIDRELGQAVDAVALFVAWHYRAGSMHETPFWEAAKRGAESALAAAEETPLGARFTRQLAAARKLGATDLARIRDAETYAKRIAPHLDPANTFGGFDAANFAQIGRGLGLLGG